MVNYFTRIANMVLTKKIMKNTIRTFSRGYLESAHGQSPICLLGCWTVSMQINGMHFHSDRYLPTTISFIRNCPMLPYPYIQSECRTGFLYEIRTQCSPEMDVWNCVSETLHVLTVCRLLSLVKKTLESFLWMKSSRRVFVGVKMHSPFGTRGDLRIRVPSQLEMSNLDCWGPGESKGDHNVGFYDKKFRE